MLLQSKKMQSICETLCRYFFHKIPAGSLTLLYLLACLLGAATIHVGVTDCSSPAVVEETGSTNTLFKKSVRKQACKYIFYGCRDLYVTFIF